MSTRPKDSETISNDIDDHTSDIVGTTDYSFIVPKRKGFLPWHKPRKQFVRHEQWCHYIGQLVDDISLPNKTLTYFGLPGIDLLDLRYFGESICGPRDLKLRFLGFNSGANPSSDDQAELNISLDEVSKSLAFDPLSEIVPDDIRGLVDDDSIAWQKTFEIGPYDVINLDLCDGFGAQEPGQFDETYYNMTSKLLAVQARRKLPWLLLLTTRVGRRHTHRETLARLAKLYDDNLSACASFKDASAKKYAVRDSTSLREAQLRESGVQPIFLVGLCKWLIALAVSQNPPSTVDVKSVLGYRVRPGSEVEDMVSLAIRFDPTHGPISDPSKLASTRAPKIDECDLATKALKRVSGLLDVDEYLASEQEVRNEMIEAMCKLLAEARYDVDEYRKLCAS